MIDASSNATPSVPARLGSGEMFDKIASRYDVLNRILSGGVDHSWRRKTVAAMKLDSAAPGARALDLATGTADLAIRIARSYPTIRVVGVDPSREMLHVGEQKVAGGGLRDRVELQVGDAQALQLATGSIEATCIAFGIRNVPDRARALREMARVTRVGGRVCILELGEPRNGIIGPLARFHIHHVVPRLGALLSGSREYRYLQESIAAFPAPGEFADVMNANRLRVLEIAPLTFGVCTLYIAESCGPEGA